MVLVGKLASLSCFCSVRQFFVFCVYVLVLSVGVGVCASDSAVKAAMCRDLDSVHDLFALRYAPTEWKREYVGWDLDLEIAYARERVRQHPNPSDKDFQCILRDFANSTQDYHVRVFFHSTETATLPFLVRGIEGRYFFVSIDRERLPYQSFPVVEGDEILSFDGRPIHEVVMALRIEQERQASDLTDQALAEHHLTHRFGFEGSTVPNGSVIITVASRQERQHRSFQLEWDYEREQIHTRPDHIASRLSASTLQTASASRLQLRRSFKKKIDPFKAVHDALAELEWALPEWSESKSLKGEPQELGWLGDPDGFLPDLGTVLWEHEGSFRANLCRIPSGQSVGYVRIPFYEGGDLEVEEFATIISTFNDCADVLVIDQLHNPGGNLLYAHTLLSMLTEYPLTTPRHRIRIDQTWVLSAAQALAALEMIHNDAEAREALGETISGYPVSYQTIESLTCFFQFILDEWNAGKTLTDNHHLYSMDRISPYPKIQFKKPILMLVDHMAFSCGDMIPAILQDNHRATIMGTRTAGAGGAVRSVSFPNHFGIFSVKHTTTLAERSDHSPIENLGVQPDIAYSITVDDLISNYAPFVQAINNVAGEMVQGGSRAVVRSKL